MDARRFSGRLGHDDVRSRRSPGERFNRGPRGHLGSARFPDEDRGRSGSRTRDNVTSTRFPEDVSGRYRSRRADLSPERYQEDDSMRSRSESRRSGALGPRRRDDDLSDFSSHGRSRHHRNSHPSGVSDRDRSPPHNIYDDQPGLGDIESLRNLLFEMTGQRMPDNLPEQEGPHNTMSKERQVEIDRMDLPEMMEQLQNGSLSITEVTYVFQQKILGQVPRPSADRKKKKVPTAPLR